MNRRRTTTAAVLALVLLSIAIGGVCGYLLGRGGTDPSRTTPDVVQEVEQEAEFDPAVRAAHDARVRQALREIDADYAGLRAQSLQALREAGYDQAQIVRLVVSPKNPDWQGRALADLLSTEPDAALAPLLHRITHSAPLQRARICEVLGASARGTAAASAVLAVRALLDNFDGVREHALASLRVVDPPAAEAVLAHNAKGRTLSDGSVAGLDPSLLVEARCPYASGSSRSTFVKALRADGERFGAATVIRVGGILAMLPDGEKWLLEALRELTTYDLIDPEGASLLASVGPVLVPALRRRLLEPDAPAFVAYALGELGPHARGAVPDLLQVVIERRPVWQWALLAAARVSAGGVDGDSVEVETDALLPLIHDEEMGEFVAWALGEMGATSPRVVEALCTRLEHWVMIHHGGLQSEGALKRILAAGAGFENVEALLHAEDPRVVRAATRILSFCHERDRPAAVKALESLRASTSDRSTRRAVDHALRLLGASEDVRRAELERQVSALRPALAPK